VFTDVTSPTWLCDMTLAQDWANAASLVNYLLTNYGTQKTCVFKPNNSGGAGAIPTFTATLILAAPEIGGDIDAWATTTVQHAVVGVPVKTLT